MTALTDQQFFFSKNLPRLIDYAHSLGYDVQFGELWRSPQQAAWNAAHNLGISNSNHCNRLAVDLILWKDGKICETMEHYRPLAEFWKKLSQPGFICVAGADFMGKDKNGKIVSKPDLYHFSMFFNGIK